MRPPCPSDALATIALLLQRHDGYTAQIAEVRATYRQFLRLPHAAWEIECAAKNRDRWIKRLCRRQNSVIDQAETLGLREALMASNLTWGEVA